MFEEEQQIDKEGKFRTAGKRSGNWSKRMAGDRKARRQEGHEEIEPPGGKHANENRPVCEEKRTHRNGLGQSSEKRGRFLERGAIRWTETRN